MTKLSKTQGLFFLLSLFLSTPANATRFLITYTGFVAVGTDQEGIFGMPNAILTGLPFRAEFIFNDPSPGAEVIITGNFDRRVIGGTTAQTPSISPVNGFLIINGNQHFFDGNSSLGISQVNVRNQDSPLQIEDLIGVNVIGSSANNLSVDTNTIFINLVDNTGTLTDSLFLRNLFYRTPQPNTGRFGVGSFSISTRPIGGVGVDRAFGILSPEFISVGILNDGVPEPATWSMIILGFGLVGSFVRRGKTRHKLMSL